MKRVLTSLVILSLLFVFMGAKANTSKDVTVNAGNDEVARYENPLADGFTSVYKGKGLVKGIANGNLIHLPYYEINVTAGEPVIREDLRAKETKGTANYYIVQCKGPVTESYKDEMRALGVKFEWPVRNYAYIVKMDDAAKTNVEKFSFVSWVSIWHPAYKAKGTMLESKSTEVKRVVIRLFKNADYDMAVAQLKSLGIKIVEQSGPKSALYTIVAEMPVSRAADVARLSDVYLMSEAKRVYSRNDDGRAILMTGNTTLGDTVVWTHGVRGSGQIVNVTDSGITTGHYAFYDSAYPISTWGYYPSHRKVVAYLPSNESFLDTLDFGDDANNSFHGTHVSGTVAGNDGPFATSNYDGIAKDAKLFFMDTGNNVDAFLWVPVDCYTMFDTMYVHGVRITSNSYGPDGTAEWGGAYDEGCQMTDAYCWDHKDFNVVFAAGNDGSSAGTVSGTACAKDVFSVGSVSESSPNSISSFSSRGPTADGRYGVTILSPGETVMSADGNTSGASSSYKSMQGTSMATPFTAGSVALMRDYLSQGFYPTGTKIAGNAITNASSALIRAMAVNSANNCGQAIPNNNYGWGRLQLNNCLYFNDTAPKAIVFDDNQDGLLTGEYIEYQFNVTNGSSELKVTLVWTDYPSPYFGDNTVTDTTLVNDLDLRVYNPTGTLVSGTDHLNPMEQYTVAAPATGVWKVRVNATDCPVSPQPYALVVSYNVANQFNGYVKFDKAVYSVNDNVATITVTDNTPAIPDSVVVMVTSMVNDTEYAICRGTTGIYTGTITMDYARIVSADGILSITDADTLWATYVDASPVQTLKAMATTDGKVFTISNVHTETVEGTRAFIAWNTSEVATGKVYYGLTTALGSETAVDPNLVTDHSGDFAVIISGLSSNTIYYYDVESADHKGNTVRDDNAGKHYSFATVDIAGKDILVLVTDDNLQGEIFANPEFLTYAIEQGGWNYAWWQTSVNNFGRIPVTNLMQSFKAIFLQSGQENYPPLTKDQEESLKRYEANGGRIAYTGHDFGWAMASSDGFASVGTDKNDSLFVVNYMMGKYVTNGDIIDVGNFTLYGVASDPISGSYTAGVSYNPYRSGADGDSMTAVSAAFVAGTGSNVWRWNAAAGPVVGTKWQSTATLGSSGVGTWGGYQTRVIFNAFEITQIDTVNHTSTTRTNILNNNLIWLIGHDHPDVTMSSPVAGTTYTTSPVSIAWTATTYGGSTLDSVIIEYSPNGGDTWYSIVRGTGATVTSPYSWNITSLLNGSKYVVKVTAKDGGLYPSMSGMAESGLFTINRVGNDTEGPLVYAGSVRPSSNPACNAAGDAIPNSFVLTATICDSATGLSNIGAAEWSRGATPAPAGTGTPMTAVDGSFNSLYENVTATISTTGWPVGENTIWVRGRDSSSAKSVNNWGAASSGTVTIVQAATAIQLTSFAALSENNQVVLNWTTANESNNAYFIVEKATKDGEFAQIGKVQANNRPSTYTFTDEGVFGGESYLYRLTDVSTSGEKITHPAIKVVANGMPKPTTYKVSQNWPNPFRDKTVIEYAIPVKGKVELAVYDVTGKLVKTLVSGVQDVSWYRAEWNGKDNSGAKVASGVYFYKLTADGFESSMKMTYLK